VVFKGAAQKSLGASCHTAGEAEHWTAGLKALIEQAKAALALSEAETRQ
jgi:hypothetical protein